MGQQYRIKRRTHNVALLENSVQTLDLPKGYDIETLLLHVTGVANVTTSGGSVRAMAPCQLIKRVELIADGKNTIASIPGWALVKNFGRDQSGLMIPPTGFAIAAYNVEMFGTLDQCLVDGIRPKDSNLRTSGMSLLQLRITTGALTDMFTAGAGTMTTFTLNVGTVETIELPDAKGVVSSPLYLQKRSYQDIAIPATNANQQVILPIGNALRGVQILATVAGEPSNAVLNNIQLASGVDVRVNMPANMIQRLDSVDYGPSGIGSNPTLWASSQLMDTGLYLVDLMNNGPKALSVTNAWDLSKASEAKLVLDVTGGATTQLTIVTTEFVQ